MSPIACLRASEFVFPSQADVVVQVHYHPSGKAVDDRIRVGIYLSRKPTKQALHWNNASSYDFRIPPGKNNVEVKASWMIPCDVEAIAVSPHMHLLGHDMHMSVRMPGGKIQNLIHIADWDPSWQSAYYFQSPISLPAGSVVNVVAHYDNSAHARNPNQPPKTVKVGQNFDDEMCVGYIALVKKGQDLTVARCPRRPVRDLLQAARAIDPPEGRQEEALRNGLERGSAIHVARAADRRIEGFPWRRTEGRRCPMTCFWKLFGTFRRARPIIR